VEYGYYSDAEFNKQVPPHKYRLVLNENLLSHERIYKKNKT